MLTYDELLNNYKTLIELVADLKAEKEAYIEAKREVYEHPQFLPKNFDSTSFSSQDGYSQSDMLEIKKQIDFLLGLSDGNN